MAKYLLYAHLESDYVSNGQILNGYQPIGIIGATGKGAVVNGVKQYHLHLAVEEKSTDPDISFFYKWGSATRNPHDIIKQYGKVSPNDITLEYKATTYPYSSSNPHEGLDISGVIDKNYESAICYSPEDGKVKVVKTGFDNSYGNYVICKLLGHKENEQEQDMKAIRYKSNFNDRVSFKATHIDVGNNTLTLKGKFHLNGSNKNNWMPSVNFLLGGEKEYTSSSFKYIKRELLDSKTNEIEYIMDTSKLPRGNYVVVVGVMFKGGGDKEDEWYFGDIDTSNMNVHLGTNNNLQIRIN